MSKYDKISNYTVEYENFTKIIREFEGYILGLTNNNIILFSDDIDKDLKRQYSQTSNKINEKDKDFIYKKILAPKLFDRTTGAYFTKNLARESSMRNIGLNDDLGDYLNILFSEKGLGGVDISDTSINPEGFYDALLRYTKTLDGVPGDPGVNGKYGISEALPYINGIKLVKETKKDSENNDVKDENGENVDEIVDYATTEASSLEFHSDINNESFPNRFEKPNLSAYVSKIYDAGILSRQKSHLPIFFGAIPPIEMSRCVPYIDIKIISTSLDQQKNDPLDMVSFMRFVRNKDGEFVSKDGIGMMEGKSEDVNIDLSNDISNVALMDIFNSPQTLANANINKDVNNNSFFDNILGSNSQVGNVYEPIMPFMTLKNLTTSITGMGVGLFASKKASLSLVLHDRSRLKDISPLVAIDQFATTKVQIEFGWNHPDGGVNSGNIIGQYLDALKDVHVYQVVGSDYQFGSSNSIDVSINLVAYGYRTATNIHCGAGKYVPLSTISDLILLAADQASRSLSFNETENENLDVITKREKISEVRQKIKLNSRSARQLSSVITWEQWNKISSKMKNKKEFIKYLSGFLLAHSNNNNDEVTSSVPSVSQEELDPLGGVFNEENKETLAQAVFSKINGLFSDHNDPFIYCINKDAKFESYGFSNATNFKQSQDLNEGERYADLEDASVHGSREKPIGVCTLGKLLLNFVGLPVASSCLYDEVQMIFYPLNHHAGKARGHTTASLPIDLLKVEQVVVERINQNINLSVKGFFNLIEQEIISDRSSPVYGFSNLNSIKELGIASENKTPDEIFFAGLDIVKQNVASANGIGVDDEINSYISGTGEYTENNYNSLLSEIKNDPDIKKEKFDEIPSDLKAKVRELYDAYTKKLANSVRSEISQVCKHHYENDGLDNILSEAKFVKPNLTMVFEVCPAIESRYDEEEKTFGESTMAVLGLTSTKNGLTDKTIMRIHVYDEEAISSPSELTLLSTLIDNSSGENIIGNSSNIDKTIIDKLTFYDAKEFVKRTYPTIIYGSSTSTIKSLSVRANTSGELSNVLMVESYGKINNPQEGQNYDTVFEEVTVFPNSVSCTIMGMPMISRGSSIFIDFGTNTSLDNIYTVKSVTHSISSGNFSTDLELVPSNMGAISSFRDKLSDIIEKTRK